MLQNISEAVADGLTEQMDAQTSGDFQLQSLTVGDGVLTATGIVPQQ